MLLLLGCASRPVRLQALVSFWKVLVYPSLVRSRHNTAPPQPAQPPILVILSKKPHRWCSAASGGCLVSGVVPVEVDFGLDRTRRCHQPSQAYPYLRSSSVSVGRIGVQRNSLWRMQKPCNIGIKSYPTQIKLPEHGTLACTTALSSEHQQLDPLLYKVAVMLITFLLLPEPCTP